MSNVHDSEYLNTCKAILDYGRLEPNDRTGVGRIRLVGQSMTFDMAEGFPMLTSAQKSFKNIQLELQMFLQGITHNSYLTDQGVNIWTKNAAESGDLGPVYGAIWRGLHEKQPVDQLAELMHNLLVDPVSSRHIVNGWIPELLPDPRVSYDQNVRDGKQCLPPCHTLWQVHCVKLTLEERLRIHKNRGYTVLGEGSDELLAFMLDKQKIPKIGASVQLYQRSADFFLGVPYNIASYALLLHIICHSMNFEPMELIWNGGDCHIYSNHVEQMREQISRKGKAPESPTLHIHSFEKHPWLYETSDFELRNYNPLPAIKGEMAA